MADEEGAPARPIRAARVRDHPIHHRAEKELCKRSLPQSPDTENDKVDGLKRAKQRMLRDWQSEDAGVTPLHELVPVPVPVRAPTPLHPLVPKRVTARSSAGDVRSDVAGGSSDLGSDPSAVAD